MPAPQFYPALNKLVSSEKLPEPIKSVVDQVSNKLFYKSYYVDKSMYGEAAFHHIVLVFKDGLGFTLFGGEEGFEVIFNPDVIGNSVLPISIYYNLPILKYIRRLKLEDLSSIEDYFNLVLEMFNISYQDLLSETINVFLNGFNDPVQAFVDDFNTNPDNIDIPPIVNPDDGADEYYSTENTINDIIEQLDDRNINIFNYVLSNYIDVSDFSESFEKLSFLFKNWLGEFDFNLLISLFIPKFSASIQQLQLALAFPRTWLKPVDVNGEVIQDENVKSLLKYNAGSLSYHSEKGLEFNQLDSFDLTPSQIGNTGLIIEIQDLKFDFRSDKNIPEATADGRPDAFKGVYVQYAAVTLPPNWFNNDEVVGGVTAKVAGYNLLIGTGGVSGTIALESQTFRNSDGSIINYYTDYFQFEYPIQTTHKNASNTIVYTDITNHTELKNQLEAHEATQFVFPLSLTKVGESEPTIYENVADYYSYLNTLYDTSDEANKPRLSKRIGSNGFEVWFTSFDITFHQNQVVGSNIHGGLKIPKLKDSNNDPAEIEIFGHLTDESNFFLTASEAEGIPLNLFDVLTITFQSVELGKENDVFYIEADTIFSFPEGSLANNIFKGQEVDLPALRYYANGRFEIKGNTSVPTNLSLPIGPVEMSVTAIHLGSIQREYQGRERTYNYIGFDGGISVDPLGLDIRGGGVKYYYTIDNNEGEDEDNPLPSHSYFHISTLEIDLVIPGDSSPGKAAAIIKGSLTIPEPGVSTEYSGMVSLQIPEPQIYGEVNMSLDPSYPAYYLDASVEFPIPIPLGPIGIYGFRGLIGYRYVAEKQAIGMTSEDKWYDYYTAPERGINRRKFSGPAQTVGYSDPFSIGLGATLGTMDGGGRTASLRAMMLLSLPSMFAIDAGLTILSERLGLIEDDPTVAPFYAFVIIGDDSIEFGAGADFGLNKSNRAFIDIKAELQAGFFFKNQHPWYINFGTKENPNVAIIAKDVLALKMQSFLMLSASGIEAGARVDFDFDLIFIKALVSLEVGGQISFERPQVGGYLHAEGSVKLNLYILKVSLYVDIYFSVEIAKPFLIYATFEFKMCARFGVGWFSFKVCIGADVTFKWKLNDQVDRNAIPPLTYDNSQIDDSDYPKTSRVEDYVKGVHMLTSETFSIQYLGNDLSEEPNPTIINTYIPLDTYVDLKVEKGLNPTNVSGLIGSHTGAANNIIDLIPPQKTQPGGHVLRQVKHRYSLEDVEIKAYNGTDWVNYHPFKAILLEDNSVDNLKIGHWQRNSGQYDTLRILATNPFSFLDGAEPGWFIPEQYGITPSELFCVNHNFELDCVDFLNKSLGLKYFKPQGFNAHNINGAYFTIRGESYINEFGVRVGDHAVITDVSNPHGMAKSLTFENHNPLTIILPETAVKVNLKLSTNAENVTIKYYRAVNNDAVFQEYELVSTVVKSSNDLDNVVTYDNSINLDILNNISKIEIIPDAPNVEEINNIYQQIEELFTNNEEASNGITGGLLPSEDQAIYNQLLIQLESLKAESCNDVNDPCKKIEGICQLLKDKFQPIYKDKFIAYINSLSEITAFIEDYSSFLSHINDSFDSIFIIENLEPEYTDYKQLLNNISTYEGDNESDSIIISYYNLRLNAKSLIDKLVLLGNCNCSEKKCKTITELCNLYTSLLNLYDTCFPYDADETKDIDRHYNCYTNFNLQIKDFINSENNLSNELEEYLGNDYQAYTILLQEITSWDTGNDFVLHKYVAFRNAAFAILNKIYELGNCDCKYDLDLKRVCTTSLQEVCWLSYSQYEHYATIPTQGAVEEDMQLMVEGLQKTVQPIWRPNTAYYIKFTLRDEVDDGEGDVDNSRNFDYYFGFKTAGSLGHFHKYPDVNYLPENTDLNFTDEYPITSLNAYLDHKRSYPNANGNLLNAKPIFYGNNECKISLFFKKQFVYHMLNSWGEYNGLAALIGNINIMIKDPVSDVIIPYPLPQEWEQNESVPEPQTSATCLEFSSSIELNDLPEAITVLDVSNTVIGTYNVLKWDYFQASDKYRLRIEDQAEVSSLSNIVGGQVSWIINELTSEFEITAMGSEDATWIDDNDPNIPHNIQMLNNFINFINNFSNAIECDIDLGNPIQPPAYSYSVTLTNLKPQKLYTALVFNAFDADNNQEISDHTDENGNIIYQENQKIHEFVFQTSRYENFNEQVNSFQLKEYNGNDEIINEMQAVFEHQLSLSTNQINNLFDLFDEASTNTNTDLQNIAQQFNHKFDRAVEGVLELQSLNPPTTTDFIKIININTGEVIALLVRNPEPFNIPKIPLQDIEGTIVVISEGTENVNNNYKIIHSKDYSQALIMHESKKITVASLNLRFFYKIWNGSSYEISETVIIDDIQIN